MALDLQGRRHLTVGNREWLFSNNETPHTLYRRELLVHARYRGTDRFGERRIDSGAPDPWAATKSASGTSTATR